MSRRLRGLWPNIEAATSWLERHGDRDGDGFVEYGRRTNEGLANQGWKDSHDSIFHADGSLAKGPIALVEVQAYAFGAWRAAAAIARAVDRPERAVAFDERGASATHGVRCGVLRPGPRTTMCSRSTAKSALAGCAPPTQATRF